MNNISNVLKMIDLLSTGKIYTVKELADILNVSPRMIRYYKDKLDDVGIYVESYLGVGGGYVLYKKLNYYNQLNKYDIKLLKKLNEQIKDYGIDNKGLENIINKLDLIDIITDNDNIYDTVIQKSDKTDIIIILENAIKNKSKLKIVYENIEGINRERIVQPFQIFKHGKRLYVVCYCEYKQDFRHFEVSRIQIIN